MERLGLWGCGHGAVGSGLSCAFFAVFSYLLVREMGAGVKFLSNALALFKKESTQIASRVMKKHAELMMDDCEFFVTEDEAIAARREVNRGLNSKDPACCAVVAGPEDNYAVVDLETAMDLLDFGGEAPLPCLVVTD